jgi:hypothetical protein
MELGRMTRGNDMLTGKCLLMGVSPGKLLGYIVDVYTVMAEQGVKPERLTIG